METLQIIPSRTVGPGLRENGVSSSFSGVRQVGFASLLLRNRKVQSFCIRARSYTEDRNGEDLISSSSNSGQNEEPDELLLLGTERDSSGSVVGFQLIPHSAIGHEKILETQEIVANSMDERAEDLETSDQASTRTTYNVIFVTAEAAPYSKTGGLGDVCGSLPIAMAARGHRVMVVCPRYLNGSPSDEVYANAVELEQRSQIYCFGGVQEVFIDHLAYQRPGTPYGDTFGAFGDNQFRFTLLCHAACEAPLVLPLGGFNYGEKCLFLANDWHAGLVPVLLAAKYRPCGVYKDARSIIVIHNIAHQGVEPAATYRNFGVPGGWYKALEWVFPTGQGHMLSTLGYSWEITTPEGGYGLHELLSSRSSVLTGITNGIDCNEWNPSGDEHIASQYSVHDLSGKIMLGSGEKQYEDWMRHLEGIYKDKFRGWVGFNVPISHRITAGCDILIMPSRFEPCGLNQLYAMRYGTIPVVHHTGGLRDTVQNFDPYANEGIGEGTGWTFSPLTKKNLLAALRTAVWTYKEHKPSWEGLMKRGMERDSSWDIAATQYEQVIEWAFIDPPYAG
ncbi:UNVERIFIED_CONTAM: Soluble starch synthase 1, chloroplastic/amyloplastic [Sesamum latifolium]|uniref:Soluble starch synthase 1, chloroplastic/amyloplastic n=1 Tax=Sesamum latifolium TaxID=2727402 RepID=A0AAW2T881_9LAMI